MNCFVTKITDSIPNDATHNPMLHKMNEFVLKVKPLMTGKISIPTFRSSNVVVKTNVLGGETLNIATSSIDRFQGYTVNSLDDLYLKVSDVDSVDYIRYSKRESPNEIAFDISGFAAFDNVKTLILSYSKNISGDISNLSNLVNLTNLDVEYTSITGDISNLSNLVNLTNLNVEHTSITGDISNLSNLVNLTNLDVKNSNITGDISSLSNLVNLTNLEIIKSNITGDISSLSNLVNLTNLYISSSNITGDIKALAKLTQLVEINTSDCALSGTIESLANEIAKAKVAHVLKIWTLGAVETKCTITYNGNKAVKRVWTITFAADGTYTVENTDN